MARGRSRVREPDENADLDIQLGLRKPPRKTLVERFGVLGVSLPIVGVGALAVVAIGMAMSRAPKPSVAAAEPVAPLILSARLPAPDLDKARMTASVAGNVPVPAAQVAFLNVIDETRKAFRAGENDLRKGAARMRRAEALCGSIPGRVASDWVGVVTVLTSNGEGKGAMTLRVGDRITVGTWQDWFSDIGHWTLMEAGTPVHEAAMTLRTGDKVRFSGRFLPDETDCIYEQSLTQRGSMTEPEFTFRFEALAKVR